MRLYASTFTIWELPPETRRHKKGNSGDGLRVSGDGLSVTKCAMIWPWRWLTSIRGIPSERAKPLANDVPTSKEPSSPGPRVKAIADKSDFSTPARLSAVSITGTILSWCARLASSGTTPPNSSCTFCEAVTFESRMPSRITAAEVSSQLDSIANMTTFFSISGRKSTLFFWYIQNFLYFCALNW